MILEHLLSEQTVLMPQVTKNHNNLQPFMIGDTFIIIILKGINQIEQKHNSTLWRCFFSPLSTINLIGAQRMQP